MKSTACSAAKAAQGNAVHRSAILRFLTICLFASICYLSSGQTPQGFTYQALAFDASGEPIRNTALPVRISIESDSLGGTLFWQELHSSVTTNGSGFFSGAGQRG
ncbi:MAG: hypothetical protein U5L72_01605 [Bacteroidales bacterium]|nr:hypothetical protein [Bacteroidales bacterium]